jgi:uncharacterized protein (DUF2252 family)
VGRISKNAPLAAPLPVRGPKASTGDLKAGSPDLRPRVADAFNGAAPAGLKDGLTRPPESALEFVDRFNAQLGLGPKDVSAKDQHMAAAPTHFLTAMPALFYQDVRGPFAAASQLRATPSPVTLLVGDAHLGNLMTRSSNAGKTVWGWGDCDKSGRGNAEWDLARLATDTVLSAREAKKDSSKSDQAELVAAVSEGYTQALRDFAQTGQRPPAYLEKKETGGELHDFIKNADDKSQKKLVDDRTKGHQFPKRQQASPANAAAVRSAVAQWASRLPADAPVGRPIEVFDVGVDGGDVGGSNSGLAKFLALVQAPDPKDPPILLKFKQVLPSAVENGTGNLARSNAAKVAANTAALEGERSPLVGYAEINGRSCLVQPLDANTDILDPAKLKKKDFLELAKAAGVALARSQLQSDDLTPAVIERWLGSPATDAAATERLSRFATSYADQTEADTKALQKRN